MNCFIFFLVCTLSILVSKQLLNWLAAHPLFEFLLIPHFKCPLWYFDPLRGGHFNSENTLLSYMNRSTTIADLWYDEFCWKWPSVWWMHCRQGVSHNTKNEICKRSFIGIKGPNVFSRNYSTSYCTTPKSLDRRYKVEWIQTFMLFVPNSNPTIQMSQ